MTNTHEGKPRTREQITKLFAIAVREIHTIEQLTGCVAHLHEFQAAKPRLATLSQAEVCAAPEFRRYTLGEG